MPHGAELRIANPGRLVHANAGLLRSSIVRGGRRYASIDTSCYWDRILDREGVVAGIVLHLLDNDIVSRCIDAHSHAGWRRIDDTAWFLHPPRVPVVDIFDSLPGFEVETKCGLLDAYATGNVPGQADVLLFLHDCGRDCRKRTPRNLRRDAPVHRARRSSQGSA